MKLVCVECGQRVAEKHALTPDPLQVAVFRARSYKVARSRFAWKEPEGGLYHRRMTFETRFSTGVFCGPLREWNDGDDYVAWAENGGAWPEDLETRLGVG